MRVNAKICDNKVEGGSHHYISSYKRRRASWEVYSHSGWERFWVVYRAMLERKGKINWEAWTFTHTSLYLERWGAGAREVLVLLDEQVKAREISSSFPSGSNVVGRETARISKPQQSWKSMLREIMRAVNATAVSYISRTTDSCRGSQEALKHPSLKNSHLGWLSIPVLSEFKAW